MEYVNNRENRVACHNSCLVPSISVSLRLRRQRETVRQMDRQTDGQTDGDRCTKPAKNQQQQEIIYRV